MSKSPSDGLELKPEYIAGVFDAKSVIYAGARKDTSYNLGYTVYVRLQVKTVDHRLVAILEEWSNSLGVHPQLREKREQYIWEVSNREDVETLINEVKPHLLVQYEVAEVATSVVLPALDEGKHRTRQGFLDLLEVVREVNEISPHGGETKYTVEHFEELWEDELSGTA